MYDWWKSHQPFQIQHEFFSTSELHSKRLTWKCHSDQKLCFYRGEWRWVEAVIKPDIKIIPRNPALVSGRRRLWPNGDQTETLRPAWSLRLAALCTCASVSQKYPKRPWPHFPHQVRFILPSVIFTATPDRFMFIDSSLHRSCLRTSSKGERDGRSRGMPSCGCAAQIQKAWKHLAETTDDIGRRQGKLTTTAAVGNLTNKKHHEACRPLCTVAVRLASLHCHRFAMTIFPLILQSVMRPFLVSKCIYTTPANVEVKGQFYQLLAKWNGGKAFCQTRRNSSCFCSIWKRWGTTRFVCIMWTFQQWSIPEHRSLWRPQWGTRMSL